MMLFFFGLDQSVDVVFFDNKDGIKNQMIFFEDVVGEIFKEEKKGDGDESLSKEEKIKEEFILFGETKSEIEGLKDNLEEENFDFNEK